MDTENMVKYILDTYELKPRFREKIERVAIEGANYWFIHDFDTLYGYISDLIEKSRGFYKTIESLGIESANSVEHEYQEHLFSEESNAVPVSEIPVILDGQLDNRYAGILSQLLSMYEDNPGNPLEIFPEAVLDTIEHIKETLDELERLYGVNGEILMPRRPIISIECNPLAIKFGRRRFNGNPLAYFNEHEKIYRKLCGGEITRTRLMKVDESLYRALWQHKQLDGVAEKKTIRRKEFRSCATALDYFRSNFRNRVLTRTELKRIDYPLYRHLHNFDQIDEAIPETLCDWDKTPLCDEDVDYVISLHSVYEGNALKAAENEKFGRTTFLKYWKNAGLPILDPGYPRYSDAEIDRLVMLYREHGNIRKLAEITKHDTKTISKYLKKRGIKIVKGAPKKKNKKLILP
ncbi:MAG: hypothetical protein ABIF08_03620 [Nanoarchaeota archaeon]